MQFPVDALKDAFLAPLPTEGQSAQLRVVLGHNAVLAGFHQAVDRCLTLRRAHIDETAQSPPLDDTTAGHLSVGIRRLFCVPVLNWYAANRPFFASLKVALSETQATVNSFPDQLSDIVEALNELCDNDTADTGYLLSLIPGYRPSTGAVYALPVAWPVPSGDPDDIVVSSQGENISWANVVNGFSRVHYGSLTTTNSLIVPEIAQGVADAIADEAIGENKSYDGWYEMGYLIGRIHLYQKLIEDGGSKYVLSNTVTVPSLVADIGLVWSYVRDWIEGDFADYGEYSIDLFDATFDGYLSNLQSS
jgi:hypothetical protein